MGQYFQKLYLGFVGWHGNQNSQKRASKFSNYVWIESFKSAKKDAHALRVAVSNKAGSGKVSGSYVQHTSGEWGSYVQHTTSSAVGLVGARMPCSCRLQSHQDLGAGLCRASPSHKGLHPQYLFSLLTRYYIGLFRI